MVFVVISILTIPLLVNLQDSQAATPLPSRALNTYWGKLVKSSSSPKTYYITQKGFKRWMPTAEVFLSYKNSFRNVLTVSDSTIQSFPEANVVHVPGNSKIYKLQYSQNGQLIKRWIPTPEIFNKNGLRWNEIVPVNVMEMNYYLQGSYCRSAIIA